MVWGGGGEVGQREKLISGKCDEKICGESVYNLYSREVSSLHYLI